MILDRYKELLTAVGFDDAILGVDPNSNRVIYSVTKCVNILMEEDGMDFEEAYDYLSYNSINAWVGEQTPIWCDDLDQDKPILNYEDIIA
jgi:hypothetical protein